MLRCGGGDGGDGRVRQGSPGPRGTRALLRGGWAPSGRAATDAACRERILGDPWRTRPPPPSPPWSTGGSVGSESQVFEGRGVVMQRDAAQARLGDARADPVVEAERVERDVYHALVGELLDPMEQRLAPATVQLARLPLAEIVDAAIAARREARAPRQAAHDPRRAF